MKARHLLACSLVLTALLTRFAWSQAPGEASAVPPRDCDRGCLLAIVRDYMGALKDREPARAPLAPAARFTENDVEMPFGREGLWRGVTGVAPSGLELADPLSGNAAWFGLVEERGAPAYFAVRIRVEHRRIVEVETVVHRKGGLPAPFGDPAQVTHDTAFADPLTEAERRPRERLIAVANGYFSTVELNDGQLFTHFDPECQRLENGISTTRGSYGAAGVAEGCESQFKLGLYRINKRVRERRFPLVDEERGIVVATGFFDHANTFDSYTTTDGKTRRTALKWPNSITLMEAFKIRSGSIYRIEAVFTYVPYFMHSPWARVANAASSGTPRSPDRATSASCDRSCLDQVADGYMRALVSHESDVPPWADGVRFTENGVPMAVGDALWGSVSSASESAVRAGDPSSGNVVWLGTVAEHGQPAYYAMRLRARGGKISEIESLVARAGNAIPFVSPAAEFRQPLATETLPSSERSSSRRLSALVERYYAGAAGQNSEVFGKQCVRRENGVADTPCRPATSAMHVTKVRDWHLAVVDPVRGVVVTTGYCDRPDPGALAANEGGGTASVYPHSAAFMEVFLIRSGRIERIESVSTLLAYLMRSPWSEGAPNGGP
jgi:hypothetical protein